MLADLTVNNSGDFIDFDPNVTTLREAIEEANANDEADTIKFSTDMDGATITLTEGQLEITESVSILGEDPDENPVHVTIDAGGNSRVFDVNFYDGGSADHVVFENLTIRGGDADGLGGGINLIGKNEGSATDAISIIKTVITDNQATRSGGGLFVEMVNSSRGERCQEPLFADAGLPRG